MVKMPKTKWREYLKGEYIIKDENLRNKMHHDIRQRAKQIMKDLLLIAEKSDKRQRILIFKDPDFRDSVIRPLWRELMNNSCILTPDEENYEDIVDIIRGLIKHGIKYDFVRIIEDKGYRNQRIVWLKSAMLEE